MPGILIHSGDKSNFGANSKQSILCLLSYLKCIGNMTNVGSAKCVAEWISSERGERTMAPFTFHKDSDISWRITIVDVMPTGSVKAKGE